MSLPRSVLILKPSSFGDIVHTLPAVARLKSVWPESRISWLVNKEWMPLLKENRSVDEIISFPRRDFRGAGGWVRFLLWCREAISGTQPDLALDFQGLLRSALIARASAARVIHGFREAREGAVWFYHRKTDDPPGIPHAVDRYLALADDAIRASGILLKEVGVDFSLPQGEPLADVGESGFVLLHPFARGEGKSLTPNQVEDFCQRLMPRRVIVVGSRQGKMMNIPDGCTDLLDRTSLPELIWLIRRAGFVISVDSGPAHLSAALGRPMVAIHTWSDPRRVGPYRHDAWVWKNGRLLTVQELVRQEESFFDKPPKPFSERDLEAVCALVTSS